MPTWHHIAIAAGSRLWLSCALCCSIVCAQAPPTIYDLSTLVDDPDHPGFAASPLPLLPGSYSDRSGLHIINSFAGTAVLGPAAGGTSPRVVAPRPVVFKGTVAAGATLVLQGIDVSDGEHVAAKVGGCLDSALVVVDNPVAGTLEFRAVSLTTKATTACPMMSFAGGVASGGRVSIVDTSVHILPSDRGATFKSVVVPHLPAGARFEMLRTTVERSSDAGYLRSSSFLAIGTVGTSVGGHVTVGGCRLTGAGDAVEIVGSLAGELLVDSSSVDFTVVDSWDQRAISFRGDISGTVTIQNSIIASPLNTAIEVEARIIGSVSIVGSSLVGRTATLITGSVDGGVVKVEGSNLTLAEYPVARETGKTARGSLTASIGFAAIENGGSVTVDKSNIILDCPMAGKVGETANRRVFGFDYAENITLAAISVGGAADALTILDTAFSFAALYYAIEVSRLTGEGAPQAVVVAFGVANADHPSAAPTIGHLTLQRVGVDVATAEGLADFRRSKLLAPSHPDFVLHPVPVTTAWVPAAAASDAAALFPRAAEYPPLCVGALSMGSALVEVGGVPESFRSVSLFVASETKADCRQFFDPTPSATVALTPIPTQTPKQELSRESQSESSSPDHSQQGERAVPPGVPMSTAKPAGRRQSSETAFEDAGMPHTIATAIPAVTTIGPAVTGSAIRGPMLFHVARIATCAAGRKAGDAVEGDPWLGVPRCAAMGTGPTRCLWAPILMALLIPVATMSVPNAVAYAALAEHPLVRRGVAVASLVPAAFYLPSAAGYAAAALQKAGGAGEVVLALLALVLAVGCGVGAYVLFEVTWAIPVSLVAAAGQQPSMGERSAAAVVVSTPLPTPLHHPKGAAGSSDTLDLLPLDAHPATAEEQCPSPPVAAVAVGPSNAVVTTASSDQSDHAPAIPTKSPSCDDQPIGPDEFFAHPAVSGSPWLALHLTADSYRDMTSRVVRCGYFMELAFAFAVSIAGSIRPGPNSGPAACWVPAATMMAAGVALLAYFVAVRPHGAGRDLLAGLVSAALVVASTFAAVLAALDINGAQRIATWLAVGASVAALAQAGLNVLGAAEHWYASFTTVSTQELCADPSSVKLASAVSASSVPPPQPGAEYAPCTTTRSLPPTVTPQMRFNHQNATSVGASPNGAVEGGGISPRSIQYVVARDAAQPAPASPARHDGRSSAMDSTSTSASHGLCVHQYR